MYCGINTQLFKDIPCITAIISAAELLNTHYPTIAGSFLQYATGLVQNYLSQAGSTPELDQAFLMLKQVSSNCQGSNAKELESFGDALIASANGPYASDFYRLGYISYAASSLYGLISPRVLNKIAIAQQNLNNDSFKSQSVQGSSPQFTSGAPPQFTPYGSTPSGPPQFTPGGPPQFTPSGPPQFTPGGPPSFTPNVPTQSNLTSTLDQGFPQYPVNPVAKSGQSPKENALKLTEMAKNALSTGNNDAALSMIIAAMNELKK